VLGATSDGLGDRLSAGMPGESPVDARVRAEAGPWVDIGVAGPMRGPVDLWRHHRDPKGEHRPHAGWLAGTKQEQKVGSPMARVRWQSPCQSRQSVPTRKAPGRGKRNLLGH
jgi:hypothetical protein